MPWFTMSEPANYKPMSTTEGQLLPGDDGTITWRAMLAEAVDRFDQAGTDDPEGSARRIVEQAGGFEPTEFALGLDELATVRGVAQFDSMVARRCAGEPLQYVVGSWGFRTLDLAVDRRVLIPRPETEELVGWGLEELERSAKSGTRDSLVIDLGTGSGAIGLSVLAEVPHSQVWMTDASDDALAVCRSNLAGLGLAAVRGRIVAGSWFQALPRSLAGSITLVISNPPYVARDDHLEPVVSDWEPSTALIAGSKGTEDIRHLLSEAPAWLAESGAIVVEMAPNQVGPMAELAVSFFKEVDTRADLAGRDRAVIARYPQTRR